MATLLSLPLLTSRSAARQRGDDILHIEFVLVVDVRERWREYTAVLEIKTRHRARLADTARNFQMLALHGLTRLTDRQTPLDPAPSIPRGGSLARHGELREQPLPVFCDGVLPA